MNETVTLRHPKLPPEQTIRIDRRRMGVRLAAGWVEVPKAPEPEPPASPEPAAPAADEPEPTESAPKRRSRKTTNEEQ